MNLDTYDLPDSYRAYMATRDPAVDAYYTFRERKRPQKDIRTYCLWSLRTLEEKQPVIRTPSCAPVFTEVILLITSSPWITSLYNR